MQGVFFLSGLLAYSPVRGAFSERTRQFQATTHAERAKSLPHFVLEIGASLVQYRHTNFAQAKRLAAKFPACRQAGVPRKRRGEGTMTSLRFRYFHRALSSVVRASSLHLEGPWSDSRSAHSLNSNRYDILYIVYILLVRL